MGSLSLKFEWSQEYSAYHDNGDDNILSPPPLARRASRCVAMENDCTPFASGSGKLLNKQSAIQSF